MRVIISLSPNKRIVDWGYLPALVGLFYDRIGNTFPQIHDTVSLYSLSMLSPGKMTKEGLHYPEGAYFCFSAHDPLLIYEFMEGLRRNPHWRYGMQVTGLERQRMPEIPDNEIRLRALSPVLVRRDLPEGKQEHILFDNPEADQMLTDIWKLKLRKAGLPDEDVSLGFDRSYAGSKPRLVDYRGIKNKCSACPLIAHYKYLAQAQFLLNVGAGESSGSGFGALAI